MCSNNLTKQNRFKTSSGKSYVRRVTRSSDIRCHRCSTSTIVAKNVDFIKMYRCHECKQYICEKCHLGAKGHRRYLKHDKHRDKVKEIKL